MTITVAPARNELTANAGQTIFNYTFKIFSITDLNVYITPAGQNANDSTDLTTAYTVLGVGDEDGGTITLTTGAILNDLITIVSNTPSSRTTDYQNNGDFRPDTVNADFDRVVSLVKKIEDSSNRSLLSPQSKQGPKPLSLPNPVVGELLRWNDTLSGLENISLSELPVGTFPVDRLALNYSTLAAWQADTSAQAGDVVTTKERSAGNGGGATGNVIASGTENGFNIVKHNTLPLSWELRTNKVTLNTLEWGMLESNTAAQNSAAIQAAIDFGNALFSTSVFSHGGVWVYTPSGIYDVEGWIDKQGVNIYGDGIGNTTFQLTGDNKTGLQNASATTQSFTDQLTFGIYKGFSFVPKNPPVELPVGQLIWDITGYSRWTTYDVFIGWCGGCTGIQMTGSKTAGTGGPANWYNNFYDFFVERASAWPTGGVGWILGDTAADKEQITTWGVFGGRTSGSGSGTGLNIQSCNSLNFYNHVIESCDVLIGANGAARKAISVNFYPAYFEGGAGSNLTIDANAEGTGFYGAFITGYTVVDNGTFTTRHSTKTFKTNADSAGANFWEVNITNGSVRRPTFKGSTQPGIDLTNSAATDLSLVNSSATSSATSFFRLLAFNFATVLYSFGTVEFTGGTDGAVNVGSASNRFNTVFAAVGTINTSDARLKTDVVEFTGAELKASKEILQSLGGWKWLARVEEEGEAARLHCGSTVQKAIEILTSNGLDPFSYSFICYDEWDDIYEDVDSILDEDGNEIEPARTFLRTKAGDRYSFRPSELTMFLLAGMSARLDAAGI